MTGIRTQVFEIIQDIPEEKLIAAVEVLKGLRALYAEPIVTEEKDNIRRDAFGIFSKYANPDLIGVEKEAWGMAVREKHDTH
ncbi:MAG: hypothetical protein FWH14_05865 [Oscillospiraceae bacterium]|nr:hypothetical protein [Oscillospiraceae bacterium]